MNEESTRIQTKVTENTRVPGMKLIEEKVNVNII